MNLTIFGATGRTGIELVTQALAMGHHVTAYVRNPAKLTITDEKLSVVEGSLEETDKINTAVSGADAVISALGPSGNKPGKPLTDGMNQIIEAMKAQNVKRLIVSTGAGVADPEDKPQLIGRFFSLALGLFAKHVLADSESMAEVIRNSGLDWTLARTPRLTDKPGTGQIKVGYAGKGPGTQLSRADFAGFILAQIDDDTWLRKSPMVSN